MEVLEQQIQQNPRIQLNMERIERFTQNYTRRASKEKSAAGVVAIPVVVHVVYNQNSPAQNISEAQVQSQIDVLNADFRRLNADASNTPAVFLPVAADVEIEFCLASYDPSGAPSNGITRTATDLTSLGLNDDVKFTSRGGRDAWPAGDYLNIWVGLIGGSTLGYAQFPGGPLATDGIVIDYRYFGTTGTASPPFDMGRTTTHEVGHWLNLRHIWGDGGCRADDLVADTPLAGDSNNTGLPCAFPGPNSCDEGEGDLPDMFQNYMDYSDDDCMNLFTLGQKNRMRALFEAGGARESLLFSTGCADPCPDSADSDGDRVCDPDDICAGEDDTHDLDANGIPDACDSCPGYDFDNTPILSYDPGQDLGTYRALNLGKTIFMAGNTWKAIKIDYTITPNTVLEFYFKSTSQGEIHDIGFDDDLTLDSQLRFKLYGFQDTGDALNLDYNNYAGDGQYQHYLIPIGNFLSGLQNYLLFTADDDQFASGNSYFSNIKIYEDLNANGLCDDDCDPSDGDSDGDGVCDNIDACPGFDDRLDADGDGVPDGCDTCNTNGQTCDDGDPCTINDVFDESCNCVGVNEDSDGDGVCDGEDVCPQGDDNADVDGDGIPDACDDCDANLTGQTCDDGDACTTGDVYDENCNCAGVYEDSDGDGVCDGEDICPQGDDNIDLNGNGVPDACEGDCSKNKFILTLNFDNYPEESSWDIKNVEGTIVASGGPYGNQIGGSTLFETISLPEGCYAFTIYDLYGDGLCCAYGNGSYSLDDACGGKHAEGNTFGFSETTNFCTGEPTCADGLQNGDETGIDCGGSCTPCEDNCNEVINSNFFENSLGIWNDGGNDCFWLADLNFANSGIYSVRLRDNSGSASSMFTDALDLSAYTELKVSFSYITNSMDDSTEDFGLQVSTDDGLTYLTAAVWSFGNDFINNQRYDETVVISGIRFTSATRLRFICDASSNQDQVYIDDVEIIGCAATARIADARESGDTQEETETRKERLDLVKNGIKVFPNPVSDQIRIQFDGAKTEAFVRVMDLTGRELISRTFTDTRQIRLDVKSWGADGLYLISVETPGSERQIFRVVKF